MTTKQCKICKQDKHLSDYHKGQVCCTPCLNRAKRRKYMENKMNNDIRSPSPFKNQRAFMQKAGQVINGTDKEQIKLYTNLVLEEYDEWSISKGCTPEDVKETIDLIVVCIGYLYSVGVDPQKAWNIVYENNMKKLDGKIEKRADGKVKKSEASIKTKEEMMKKLEELVK